MKGDGKTNYWRSLFKKNEGSLCEIGLIAGGDVYRNFKMLV